VVKRFLSTPGWESGGEKLRLAYDNVKTGGAIATQQMSASGRKPKWGDLRFVRLRCMGQRCYCNPVVAPSLMSASDPKWISNVGAQQRLMATNRSGTNGGSPEASKWSGCLGI